MLTDELSEGRCFTLECCEAAESRASPGGRVAGRRSSGTSLHCIPRARLQVLRVTENSERGVPPHATLPLQIGGWRVTVLPFCAQGSV